MQKSIIAFIIFCIIPKMLMCQEKYSSIGLPSPEMIVRSEIARQEALREKQKYEKFKEWEEDHPAFANARNIAVIVGEHLKDFGFFYLDTILGPVLDMSNPLTGLEMVVNDYLPESGAKENLTNLIDRAKSSSTVIKIAIDPENWRNYISLLRDIPGLAKEDQVKFLANGKVYDKWSAEVEQYLARTSSSGTRSDFGQTKYEVREFRVTYPTNNTANWQGEVRGRLRLYAYAEFPEGIKEIPIVYEYIPFTIKVFIKTNHPYYQGNGTIDSDGSWYLEKTSPTKRTENVVYAEIYDAEGNMVSTTDKISVYVKQ